MMTMNKRLELIKTTNKLSGNVRLYMVDCSKLIAKKLPISKRLYQYYESIAQRTECLHTKSDSKYIRQYKTIAFN